MVGQKMLAVHHFCVCVSAGCLQEFWMNFHEIWSKVHLAAGKSHILGCPQNYELYTQILFRFINDAGRRICFLVFAV